MSVVTNVLVHACGLDTEAIQQLEAWKDERGGQLQRLTFDDWGGTKVPEIDLWGGAFNHLYVDTFVNFVRSLPWKIPQEVQVLVEHEYARPRKFTVYEL